MTELKSKEDAEALNLPKNIQNYKNLKLIAFVIDRNSKYPAAGRRSD